MLEEENNKGKFLWSIAYAFILFVILYFFYTVVHPLYIYDTDDWAYISFSRHALPQITQWNPTKILPETLIPLTAEFGIRFIMPFTGDYIGSMGCAFALVISLAIVVYILCFGKLFGRFYGMNQKVSWLVMIILLLFHFLPFNVAETNNGYLLGGSSVTILFNYLLSGLINSSVAMYLMTHGQTTWRRKSEHIKKGFLILGIYLCINSNMFHSIILISFMGTELLLSLGRDVKRRKMLRNSLRYTLVEYAKANMFYLSVVSCWLISIWMESKGGRAQQATAGLFALPMKETIGQFVHSILGMRKDFILICVLIELLAMTIYIISLLRNKKEADGRETQYDVDAVFIGGFGKGLLCLVITVIYLLLLGAKVAPSYISQPPTMFSWLFWVMVIVFSAVAYITKKIPAAVIGLPLLLYILMFETIIDGRSYRHNYQPTSFSPEQVKALDENIIKQVMAAEEANMDSVEVLIPVHDSVYWPMPTSIGGERIATTLYRHGIISRHISITLVPDSSVNEAFHLP